MAERQSADHLQPIQAIAENRCDDDSHCAPGSAEASEIIHISSYDNFSPEASAVTEEQGHPCISDDDAWLHYISDDDDDGPDRSSPVPPPLVGLELQHHGRSHPR